MRVKAITLAIGLTLASAQHAGASTLYPGSSLQNGQSTMSPNGKYRLTMQSDGSLVMYRADGSIRYRMAKNGYIALMQHDGNFVEYNSLWSPIWNSGTAGNPGSVLTIQDDGNLVIYSPTKGPIWSIGAEVNFGDPVRSGDVVGRDLKVPGMSWAGHLGIWNGKYVAESTPPSRRGGNAIRFISAADFKNSSTYWGVASPKIPSGITMPFCYKDYCRFSYYYPQDYSSLEAREAISRATYQARTIGADYSYTTHVEEPMPANTWYRAKRGLFRCDTFVLSMLSMSMKYQISNRDREKWRSNLNAIRGGTVVPVVVFDKLKALTQ